MLLIYFFDLDSVVNFEKFIFIEKIRTGSHYRSRTRRHGATQNFFTRIAPFGSQSHRRDHSVARPDRGIYRNRRASAKQRGIFID